MSKPGLAKHDQVRRLMMQPLDPPISGGEERQPTTHENRLRFNQGHGTIFEPITGISFSQCIIAAYKYLAEHGSGGERTQARIWLQEKGMLDA